MTSELRFVVGDREALARENEQNLRFGRALVPGCFAHERLDQVRLVLERAWDGAEFSVDAVVVMILPDGPMNGTAVEIRFAEGEQDALARFVAEEPALPTLDLDAPATASDTDTDSDSDDGAPRDPKIIRIRKLSAIERMKLARDGQLEDRVLLERCFGKAVWDDLLRNPSISVPEVARIANKGTAPRILLDQIVDNTAWSRQSIVRRALLGNPRLSADGVGKLLRGLPKNELKVIGSGTAFPATVRALAKKLASD